MLHKVVYCKLSREFLVESTYLLDRNEVLMDQDVIFYVQTKKINSKKMTSFLNQTQHTVLNLHRTAQMKTNS